VDIAIMRALPNMTVIAPSDPLEVNLATRAIAKYKGPVYMRIGVTQEPAIHSGDYIYEIGKAELLKDGSDITLIATGALVYNSLQASEVLSSEGISARVINMHTIKPIDSAAVVKAARDTKAIITIEEHVVTGGLGSAVAEVLGEESIGKVLFKRMGLKDTFCLDYGSKDYLQGKYGLSARNISGEAKKLLTK
ncbi:MAG: transketolase C-terminal domain-containing protein, partial [Candidatus Omnitrophota bacterium]